MGEEGESFFSRWSRRKRAEEAQEGQRTSSPPAEAADDARAPDRAPDAGGDIDEAERQRILDSLPDIDTLSEESDFTAFMQKGVPDDLRNRALSKLWRMNPIYANLDGLNDYDGDYTDAAMVVKNLKSAYKAGRGYLFDRGGEEKKKAPSTAIAESSPESGASDEEAARAADARDEAAGEDLGHEDGKSSSESAAKGTEEVETSAHEARPDVPEEDEGTQPDGVARRQRGSAARRRWGIVDGT